MSEGTPYSPEMTAKKPSKLGAMTINALWELSRRNLKPEVQDPNSHFQEARYHLENTGNLLIFINHSTLIDTNETGHVIEDHLTSLDNVGAIIAINQIDAQEGYKAPEGSGLGKRLTSNLAYRGRRTEHWIIDNASRVKGFKLMPIIRPKDRALNPARYDQPSPATGGLSPEQFNRSSQRHILDFIRKPRRVLMLAPEGSLNMDGVLTKAEDGLGDLLRLGRKQNLRAMGLALSPTTMRNGVARPTKLYSYEDALDLQSRIQEGIQRTGSVDSEGKPLQVTISDALMTSLATEIPPKFQGYYRPMVEALSPQIS